MQFTNWHVGKDTENNHRTFSFFIRNPHDCSCKHNRCSEVVFTALGDPHTFWNAYFFFLFSFSSPVDMEIVEAEKVFRDSSGSCEATCIVKERSDFFHVSNSEFTIKFCLKFTFSNG